MAIDYQNGTWETGDRVRFHQGHSHKEQWLTVYAGLYWYSGLGSGTFFRPDGTMLLNCSPQEGQCEARRVDIAMRYVDSFVPSSFRSVMG